MAGPKTDFPRYHGSSRPYADAARILDSRLTAVEGSSPSYKKAIPNWAPRKDHVWAGLAEVDKRIRQLELSSATPSNLPPWRWLNDRDWGNYFKGMFHRIKVVAGN
jgi:hypothetical protein